MVVLTMIWRTKKQLEKKRMETPLKSRGGGGHVNNTKDSKPPSKSPDNCPISAPPPSQSPDICPISAPFTFEQLNYYYSGFIYIHWKPIFEDFIMLVIKSKVHQNIKWQFFVNFNESITNQAHRYWWNHSTWTNEYVSVKFVKAINYFQLTWLIYPINHIFNLFNTQQHKQQT